MNLPTFCYLSLTHTLTSTHTYAHWNRTTPTDADVHAHALTDKKPIVQELLRRHITTKPTTLHPNRYIIAHHRVTPAMEYSPKQDNATQQNITQHNATQRNPTQHITAMASIG